jgi:hypothetical protein
LHRTLFRVGNARRRRRPPQTATTSENFGANARLHTLDSSTHALQGLVYHHAGQDAIANAQGIFFLKKKKKKKKNEIFEIFLNSQKKKKKKRSF